MARRYYSSTAVSTSLTGSINNSTTTIPVASTTGYPGSFPYTIIVDPDTASEEVMTVTSAAGLNLTATRGVDGTTAVSHSSGAVVKHGVSARDFDEPNSHVNSASGVHSLSGSVVGTSDSQTLTNKTLTSPTINTPTITTATINGATIDSASTLGGVSGTTVSGWTTGWTSYTPTFTNVSSGTGNFKYKQIGKTLLITGGFTGGTATGAGVITMTIPTGTFASGMLFGTGPSSTQGFWNWTGSVYQSPAAFTGGQSLSGSNFFGFVEIA